jgi:hypothetical protein
VSIEKAWSVSWQLEDGQQRKTILLRKLAIFCHELLRLSLQTLTCNEIFILVTVTKIAQILTLLYHNDQLPFIHGKYDLVWWTPVGHFITDMQYGNNICVWQHASQ